MARPKTLYEVLNGEDLTNTDGMNPYTGFGRIPGYRIEAQALFQIERLPPQDFHANGIVGTIQSQRDTEKKGI